MRKLPIGIQSFEKLRNENYLYVDKTAYLQKLVRDGGVYFLSRPRRFGKSLLVSTLEAYFRGKKDLFRGLAIEAYENQRGSDAWTEYPVITFSLSGGEYNNPDGLAKTLDLVLSEQEQKYAIDPADYDLANRFRRLIRILCEKTGKPVVILVDEYDKPPLETMGVNPEQEEKNRQLYKGFFGVLKDQDQYLKFVFFTGVTKFSKVSIFSDLNQLRDISLSDDHAGICGITGEELRQNFEPEIRRLADAQGMTTEECLAELAKMYDGYHFSKSGPGLYNPFSLLNALQERDLSSYWFGTGTPTFLIRKLEASDYTIEDYTDGVIASERSLSDYREDNPDPVPLFYQSGYLTITGWDRDVRMYILNFPNREVKYGFLDSLMHDAFRTEASVGDMYFVQFIRELKSGDADSFLTRMQSLFARIPYPEGTMLHYEREWRNQIFLILALLGANVACEVHTAAGRADCVMQTKDYVYVFEFKLDGDAETALRQIEEKGYADPFRSDNRSVMKIGVNFSAEKRNITDWKIVEQN